jgi:hypothetical protein
MCWDDDLNINLKIIDIPKILQLEPILENLGYSYLVVYSNLMIKIGNDTCWVNIFPTHSYGSRTQIWETYENPKYIENNTLYPLKLYSFRELRIYGPCHADVYLSYDFGPYYLNEVVIYNHRMNNATKLCCNLKDLSITFQQAAKSSGPLKNRINPTLLPPLHIHTIDLRTSYR